MAEEKWALLSVFDKTGIADFARRLIRLSWGILASGGTAKVLKEAGIPVKNVSELVGGGAILGHRVVTLSREVHAGLLVNLNDSAQIKEMESLSLPIIRMVVCDFYPLQDAIAKPDATIDSVVELTDIGGPCMVRSAAKGGRIVVCRFQDREPILKELEELGDISPETRQKLRARAEFEVAKYVLESAKFHGQGQFEGIMGELALSARYGENAPQAPAGLFSTGAKDDSFALDRFHVVEGMAPSYNNLCDLDRLLQTLTHMIAGFQLNFYHMPFVAVGVKHGNPCGAAMGFETPMETVIAVAKGDRRAIFGGWLIFNFPITGELAEFLVKEATFDATRRQLFDGVVAHSFDPEAIEVLRRRTDKCRLVVNPALGSAASDPGLDTIKRIRYVRGGFLVQPNYTFVLDFGHPSMRVFGNRDQKVEQCLLLGWAVGATSNSNTVTIVSNNMLIGNGVGQQDRVGAAELALKRARDAGHGDKLQGAVAYSDSFFPFPDAVETLIRAGIKAILSTSGAGRDEEIQSLCVRNNVLLYQLPDTVARGFFGH